MLLHPGMENTSRNVLVVDDDIAMREMVMSLLDDVGHEAFEASNKNQALDCLARQPYDAILSDVRMPGGSGIDLLEAVREEHEGTPVILMTGFGSIQSAVEAMRAGAFDFVTKPFKREVLLSTLGRAFEKHDEIHAIENRRRNADPAAPSSALPLRVASEDDVSTSFLDQAIEENMSLSALSDLYTTRVLQHTGGNKARAAKILGINRRTLYRRGYGSAVPAANAAQGQVDQGR